MLRVAIVHHHLRPGGVTRVIETALQSLRETPNVRAAVLAGDLAAFSGESARVVRGLDYDPADASESVVASLVQSLEKTARDALGAAPDVWHIHNHALGKSIALTRAVARLAEQGAPLLLQLHDFAEDGRPAVYRHRRQHIPDSEVYPAGNAVHYAVLNGRDQHILADAGVSASRLHLLPNAVDAQAASPISARKDGQRRRFLYPTRGIRRKNLGEFFLWAAVSDPNDEWITTLKPQNPVDAAPHARWEALASELRLRVQLGVCEEQPDRMSEWVDSAHAIVTTSIAEGFGFAFLEPWLAGRPVAGRDIPAVTRDFKAAGVQLAQLYARRTAPLSWFDADRLRAHISAAMKNYLMAYDQIFTSDLAERAFSSICAEGRVDLGRLDEPWQEVAVRKLASDAALRDDLIPASLSVEAAHLEGNAAAIRSEYGLPAYARRLASLYAHVASSPPEPAGALQTARILAAFLRPEDLHLLRT